MNTLDVTPLLLSQNEPLYSLYLYADLARSKSNPEIHALIGVLENQIPLIYFMIVLPFQDKVSQMANDIDTLAYKLLLLIDRTETAIKILKDFQNKRIPPLRSINRLKKYINSTVNQLNEIYPQNYPLNISTLKAPTEPTELSLFKAKIVAGDLFFFYRRFIEGNYHVLPSAIETGLIPDSLEKTTESFYQFLSDNSHMFALDKSTLAKSFRQVIPQMSKISPRIGLVHIIKAIRSSSLASLAPEYFKNLDRLVCNYLQAAADSKTSAQTIIDCESNLISHLKNNDSDKINPQFKAPFLLAIQAVEAAFNQLNNQILVSHPSLLTTASATQDLETEVKPILTISKTHGFFTPANKSSNLETAQALQQPGVVISSQQGFSHTVL